MENALFIASKIFWGLARIDNLLLLLAALVVWKNRSGLNWKGWVSVSLLLAIVGTISFLPVDAFVLAPLENRFPFPRRLPSHVDGVIVLGGVVDARVSQERGGLEVNAAADRALALIALAHQFPNVKIVFSSGSGELFYQEFREADSVKRFVESLGLSNAFVFERDSRNTYENAVQSKKQVLPQDSQVWLLVTSAFHMPRAVGIFRKVGWKVIPYPVDFRTSYDSLHHFHDGFADTIENLNAGVKEWVGLLAYHLLGRTPELFPRPTSE